MALLTASHCSGERHLVVGNHCNIVRLRIAAVLDAGAHPILLLQNESPELPHLLQELVQQQKLTHINEKYHPDHLRVLGRPEVDGVVDRVFVALDADSVSLKQEISAHCRRLRVPVNVTDSPELCSFTLLLTHTAGDFQMGVTTSGKGCKLAARIKRDLVAALPSNIADICKTVGELRSQIQHMDGEIGAHDDDAVTGASFNALVPEFGVLKEQQATQRARWLSQIVEYYPLAKLASISIDDLKHTYQAQVAAEGAQKGSIALVGAGPGSVEMLTLGALQAIHSADLVLADKLVPAQVLGVIPKKRTRLFIARKFPGNAERAQEELLSLGLEALKRGENVVRLKQGDPYIFGRGGEEHLFFTRHGFPPRVLPGITSALAAPVYSSIPATHREVADQVLICTGTGRRGAVPNLPGFVSLRTTVFLMALHRVVELIPLLVQKGWPPALPVAIVERASCPDQRVVRTTLEKVPAAVEACGSRPPGLLIAGYACKVLKDPCGEWTVEEGCATADIAGILAQTGDNTD